MRSNTFLSLFALLFALHAAAGAAYAQSGGGFWDKFDANKDGMLDPSEVPAGMKSLVEKSATRKGLDPSKPLSIEKLLGESSTPASSTPAASSTAPAASSSSTPDSSGGSAGSSSGGSSGSSGRGSGGSFGDRSGGRSFGRSSGDRSDRGSGGDFSSRRGGDSGRSASSDSSPSGSGSSASGLSSEDYGRARRFLTATERLPSGLPDWFTRNDADRDGQISMHEYTTTWSEAKAAEFMKYDHNGDGIITPREALAGPSTVSGASSGSGSGSGSGSSSSRSRN